MVFATMLMIFAFSFLNVFVDTWSTRTSERGVGLPGTGVTRSYEPWCRCWTLNPETANTLNCWAISLIQIICIFNFNFLTSRLGLSEVLDGTLRWTGCRYSCDNTDRRFTLFIKGEFYLQLSCHPYQSRSFSFQEHFFLLNALSLVPYSFLLVSRPYNLE